MDSFMQNLGPSYPLMNIPLEDDVRELMEDVLASLQERNKSDMLPSRLDQGVEFVFDDNFNISFKATTQNYKEVSYKSEQEEFCKRMLEMNTELMSMCKELVLARDVLKEENDLLQERLVKTSQEEEVKEELERKIQLMMKEFEEKEALGKVKVEELEMENKKLTLEVNLLKEKNATFWRKVGEVSNKNKELEIQVGRLEVERNSSSKEFENLARLCEEFEENMQGRQGSCLWKWSEKQKFWKKQRKHLVGRMKPSW